jgi:hypothetical protein
MIVAASFSAIAGLLGTLCLSQFEGTCSTISRAGRTNSLLRSKRCHDAVSNEHDLEVNYDRVAAQLAASDLAHGSPEEQIDKEDDATSWRLRPKDRVETCIADFVDPEKVKRRDPHVRDSP